VHPSLRVQFDSDYSVEGEGVDDTLCLFFFEASSEKLSNSSLLLHSLKILEDL
jgi:hypothetical protein